MFSCGLGAEIELKITLSTCKSSGIESKLFSEHSVSSEVTTPWLSY